MPIRVTCPKCHTRFNVSDKFAGQEGPCPKCKASIRVPDKSEEVVIQAPRADGPLDSKGRPVLKPIKRKETVLSGVQITLIVASIIGFLMAALVIRMMIEDPAAFPNWLLGLSAFLIAPPLVYVAYAFLRDQELDPFRGQEIWVRVLICSAIYAIAWAAMPLAAFAFDDKYEIGSYIAAGIVMFAIGGTAGMFTFDLDFVMGTVHYGLYLGTCLLGRWIALGEILPTNPVDEKIAPPAAAMLWETCLPWLEASLFFLG